MRIVRASDRFAGMPKKIFALPPLDVALAVALLVLRLITLAAGIQSESMPLSYLAAPLWTLPLAWRSRYPLSAALVVSGTGVVELTVVGVRSSVVALAALVIVVYSLGAHATTVVRMLAGLTAAAISVALYDIEQAHWRWSHSLALNLLGGAAIVSVPFLGGLLVRQQRLRAQALERLAAHLEHEREERARTAVAEERMRIARELHDEVAHAMSVIAVQADAAEGALAKDPALVQRPLVAIRETARAALTDMRRVVGGLRDDKRAVLTPEPGLAMVGALLEQTRTPGLEVELRVEGEPAPLPPSVDLTAYRVLQEGLTNVRKHSRARRVELVLRYDRATIAVEVNDDGDSSGAGGGSGRGLAGIRERTALLGGEFVAGPRAHGFALRVTLPLA